MCQTWFNQCLLILILGVIGMSASTVLKSNREIRNLTKITWAHAVNSQQELTAVLNSQIQFIEADIVLGTILNDPTATLQPIMGHPPNIVSDITLSSFLDQILLFNNQHPDATKGVKLDFKSIEVFTGSMDMLTSLWEKMNYPVWINADILAGPVDNFATVPVDPVEFFKGVKQLPAAVLSIGWTTLWGPDFTEGSYTSQQVDSMVAAIKENGITSAGHEITFPVRAGIAALSSDSLHALVAAVNQTNNVTLTLWSSANDNVNVDMLQKLIFSFGLDKVYIDVPQELYDQLDLSSTATLLQVGIATLVMLLIGILFSNYQS